MNFVPAVRRGPSARHLNVGALDVPRLHQLRDAEVQDLHPALSGQEDVRRLDVTMDDPPLVGGLKTVADLDPYIHQLRQWDWTGSRRQPLEHGLPLEQLHRDERLAVVLFDLVDRADVRMIEG